MQKNFQFKIIKDEDGYYIASCVDYFIVTQGKSFEELVSNIDEAIQLSFEE